jgi:hypothetical protein
LADSDRGDPKLTVVSGRAAQLKLKRPKEIFCHEKESCTLQYMDATYPGDGEKYPDVKTVSENALAGC